MRDRLERITIEEDYLRYHSQSEVVHRIMDLKKYAHNNNDVEVKLGNRIFNTIGCNTETDFLKKYQNDLDRIGISRFYVEKAKSENETEYYNITVDVEPTQEGEDYRRLKLTTKDCTSITDFRIKNQKALNEIPPKVGNNILRYVKMKVLGNEQKANSKSVINQENNNQDKQKQTSPLKSETLQKEMEKLDSRIRTIKTEQKKLRSQLELINRIEDGTIGPKKQKMESYTTRREKLLSEISKAQYRRKIQPKLDLENIWKEKEQRYYDEEKKLERLDSWQSNAKFTFTSFTDILKNNDGFYDALMHATILPENDSLKIPLLEALIAYKQNNYDSMKETKEAIQDASEKIENFLSDEKLQPSLLEEEALIAYNEAIDNPTFDNMVTAVNLISNLPQNSNLMQLQDSMLKVLTNTKLEIPKSKESIEIDDEIRSLRTSYANLVEEQRLKIENNKETRVKINRQMEEYNKELKQLKIAKEEIQEKLEKGLLTVEDLDKKVNEVMQERNSQQKQETKSLNPEEEFTFEIPEPDRNENQEKGKDNSEQLSQEYEEYYQKLKTIADEKSIFQDESKNRTFKTQPAENIPIENEIDVKAENIEQAEESENNSELSTNNSKEEKTILEANSLENKEEQEYTEKEKNNVELSEIPTPKEDSLSILTPIKTVKKASLNLLNKIRTLDFKKKQNEILEKLKNSKVATTVLIAVVAASTLATGILATKALGEPENKLEDNTTIESEVETSNQGEFVGPIQQQETDKELTEVSATEAEPEVKETENKGSDSEEEAIKVDLESAIENARNNIVSGTQNIYDDKYDAARDENALTPGYIPSWKTSDAAAFYDEKSEVLTREQAEEAIARGEQVVVRYDNNNIPIGYAVVNNQTNDMNIAK